MRLMRQPNAAPKCATIGPIPEGKVQKGGRNMVFQIRTRPPAPARLGDAAKKSVGFVGASAQNADFGCE
jgi:hypothetical protein